MSKIINRVRQRERERAARAQCIAEREELTRGWTLEAGRRECANPALNVMGFVRAKQRVLALELAEIGVKP